MFVDCGDQHIRIQHRAFVLAIIGMQQHIIIQQPAVCDRRFMYLLLFIFFFENIFKQKALRCSEGLFYIDFVVS
jgi:hypothetical protein